MLDKLLSQIGLCKRSELDKKDIEILCLNRVLEVKEKQLSKFHDVLIENDTKINSLIEETKKDKATLEQMESELLKPRKDRVELLKQIKSSLIATLDEEVKELRICMNNMIGTDAAAQRGRDILYVSIIEKAIKDFREILLEEIAEVSCINE